MKPFFKKPASRTRCTLHRFFKKPIISDGGKTVNLNKYKIPVSVIVVTKNEEARVGQCLDALSDFDEVVVVDSESSDATCEIVRGMGVRVEHFVWDGAYPKKRQWCLDTLELAHDWVFFVDADEVVTPEVVHEIAKLFDVGVPRDAGYFVKANYVWRGKMLRYGLCNNKLVLFDRKRVYFSVVDDLGLQGMGEIEGHYQPVLNAEYAADSIGQLGGKMLHNIDGDMAAWEARHLKYAEWEAGMNARDAWPIDPVGWRQFMKRVFRGLPMRGAFAFLHCYVLKCGFLDGAAGFDFALSRARYYRMIKNRLYS